MPLTPDEWRTARSTALNLLSEPERALADRAERKVVRDSKEADIASAEYKKVALDGLAAMKSPELSTVRLMTGEHVVDIERTGNKNKARVIDVARAVRGLAADHVASIETPQGRESIATALAHEALYAISNDGHAIGWYDRKVHEALTITALAHPEILSDKGSNLAFRMILAVTSNGRSVKDNFVLANDLYKKMLDDGQFPVEFEGGGARAEAMKKAFVKMNELVANHGFQLAGRELMKMRTVREIEQRFGVIISGEHKDTLVPTAVGMGGPKIGNFFANLSGYFDSPTMDLWFMRTVGRMTGDGIKTAPTIEKHLDKLVSLLPESGEVHGVPVADMRAEIAAFKEMSPEEKQDADISIAALGSVERYARAQFFKFAAKGPSGKTYEDRSPINENARAIKSTLSAMIEAPGNGQERNNLRSVVYRTLELLESKGLKLTAADLQAVLWYYEKNLYGKLGDISESAKPWDYASAARYAVGRELGLVKQDDGPSAGSVGGGQQEHGSRPEEIRSSISADAGGRPEESRPAQSRKEEGLDDGSGETFLSRRQATNTHPNAPHTGLVSRLLHGVIDPVSRAVDSAGNKSGIYDLVAPMSAGTQETRAMAQSWINQTRKAEYSWKKIDEAITKGLTPEQRTKIWNAADEENDIRRDGRTSAGTGRGLDALNPEERAVMDKLHQYSVELWQRAKDVGMVKDQGVDYWTPRMMVLIGENGDYTSPSSGRQGTSEGIGRNFSVSAGSTKMRKYDFSHETEAAMNAAGGELVRDIRTMPLAMAKLEKAISGRELVNQIKDLGRAAGKDLVNDAGGPGFFTLDHPAFKTYGPRMKEIEVTEDELTARDYYIEDGKVMRRVADPNAPGLDIGKELRSYRVHGDGSITQRVPVVDSDGNMVMDSNHLYISDDFRGPIKAILSQNISNNKIYTGYMLLKSKAMSAIMYSPLIHNQVILGRALAYGGVRTPALYFTGHAAKGDVEFMQKMIGAGMVPIGSRNNMIDIGDIAGGGKRGSWTDPDESWIGLALQKLGNKARDGAGDGLKSAVDTFGNLWHNTLLWERVGDLQAGIARDAYSKLMAKGLDENAAATVAAHIANRYAGAIGKENMSELAHVTANITMFSKSFNAGNIGTVKDAFYGLPAGLKAQLMESSGAESAAKALDFAKNKARIGLVRDLAFAIVLTSLVQDWVKRDKNKSFAENVSEGLSGYQKRAAEMWANMQDNPLKLSSYDPYRISSTRGNEPGKQDRVDMGAQDSGRHEYMRLPSGAYSGERDR